MKVTLIPTDEPVSESAPSPEAVAQAVSTRKGRLLRQGRHSLVVDLEPQALDDLMKDLPGWSAEQEQASSNLSAYEGVLAHEKRARKGG